jgi:hypothetical protein
MRRFVWPVVEYLEASRPVKAPDFNAKFICLEDAIDARDRCLLFRIHLRGYV